MRSPGHDSVPLSGKRILLIGKFSTSKKELQEIITDLGGKTWRRNCNLPPTDLILAHATTVQQERKIETEVDQIEKKGAEFETHTLEWLFDLRDRKNGEKHNVEPLSSTGRIDSSIQIPSRQIVPVTPPPADRRTERAREGHEDPCFMTVDRAIGTIIPDTLSSSSQDKVMKAIIEPMCAPADAHNRVVERPRVLCTDKTSPSPPKRAAEVDVKFIPVPRYVDEYGSYIVVPNTKLTEMFEVIGSIGEGAYGRVVKARIVVEGDDTVSNKFVAIKINALGKECSDAARNELRILETLKMHDEKNQNQCIHAQMCFEYRGHICMVMDLLGQSTYEFLKKNKCAPYPDSQIQSFARQLFNSVAFLHDLGLVHADIKPQNIVLCDVTSCILPYNRLRHSSSPVRFGEGRYAAERRVLVNTEVRLIDFGLATFLDESPSYFHSTPAYSAPETWLYHQASFSHDIWSIGCTLVEFFTGDLLFKTSDMLEYLAMIEAIAGLKIEEEIAWITDAKFRGILSALLPNAMQEPRKKVEKMKMKHLDQIIPGNNAFLKNFADLLKRIFVLNPNHRITAKQALQHPFLVEEAQPDDGPVAAEIH
ncbi:CMGC/CLK protein kinase [Fusarium oxysporum f. sp. raphani 54005]|uniref:CMGC/CLK protein kinase n=2 Tax=Fusarium oxysporum f. sp. raphani TaxID=96318 RepID=X0BAC3_FUSOX|nr:CMGC/CLK protein kinase [Fusarium oxysporum f. sp. raphani 54005]